MAPYNSRRVVAVDHFWPYGHCDTCGKTTMYNCTICGAIR